MVSLHHVQLAMPPGEEDAARRFCGDDSFGDRLEFLEPERD